MRAAALPLAATALVSGCARTQGLGYYWQSLSGHVDLMWRARPIGDWLADAGAAAQTPQHDSSLMIFMIRRRGRADTIAA